MAIDTKMSVEHTSTQTKTANSQTHETPAESWEVKVARKQKASREKIPQQWLLPASVTDSLQYPLEKHANRLMDMDIPRRSGIMTERELSITENYNVSSLLEALASSKLTALEVTIAFSKRAAIAGQVTNCLTETYYDQAQERAKQLDRLKAEGRSAGPLHGLPISIKDGFQVAGSEATIGFVSYLGRFAQKNSPLVDILLELGAVIYVKTNIPQTLMAADSHNNVFGRTVNPYNTLLTAGGSSGGEGALVAFRGSPLGVGTDIAGSIRIPALCDGTYGFRPTASRIPYGGQASAARAGANFFLPAAGPLANDVEALGVFLKCVIGAGPAKFDSSALDIPWRSVDDSRPRKLRLGMVAEDPLYPLHPPVKRALAEAARLLQAQGHEIVPLTAKQCQVAKATELAFAYFKFSSTKGAQIKESGEPFVPAVIEAVRLAGELLAKASGGREDLSELDTLTFLNTKRFELMEDWRQIWNTHQLDAVISPSAQHTAVPHDQYLLPPYTVWLNTLDYPACVIPFMRSSKELDSQPLVIKPDESGPDYDPEMLNNLPCSIQVFTSRMRDEECFEISKIVDKCLNQKS